jgi:hypothetical protein
MKMVHVECRPYEVLVSKLGLNKKMVKHHQGKSRVFHNLKLTKDQLAMVDEDPGSPRHPYEKSFELKEESGGSKYFTDKSGNKIIVLRVKLEDWIIWVCKKENTDITKFGLPDKPNDLHDVINHKLRNFERLIDALIEKNSPSILKLKSWLV